MFSLSSVGFIIAGILFFIYSFTFNSLVGQAIKQTKGFAGAFFCLSLAFLLWGIAVFSLNQSLLNVSIIIGDLLISIGSIFLLLIQLENNKNGRNIAIILGTLFTLLLLWLRLSIYPPKPILQNGILLFNSPTLITVFFSLMILIIWLPVSIKIAHMVENKLKVAGVAFIYSSIYIMTTAAFLIFISSRTLITILISFTGIVICFVMLLLSNITVKKLLKGYKPK